MESKPEELWRKAIRPKTITGKLGSVLKVGLKDGWNITDGMLLRQARGGS